MSIHIGCLTDSACQGTKVGSYAFIGVVGMLLTTSAIARAESTRFDIAAQPLATALRAFAGQAHMQLLYDYDAVAGTSGNAVIGEIDKQAALGQLLRDTGLEVIYSSEGSATIRPASMQAATDTSSRARATQTDLTASKPDAAESINISLDEVIVTARRRDENLQTVPIAVTALSQQTLQENNVVTVTDLRSLVPSLSGATALSRDTFAVAIRGQTESNGRPGVLMYLNEVPIPSGGDGAGLAGGPGLLFDLENVQVLKGPQGTLFGLNSVGGSVLLQSARPKNEFGGRVQLGYGNYNNREVDAAINVPIIDNTLLTRIAVNGAKRKGYTWIQADPDHPNGVDQDNRDYWSVRGSVTFRPSDWFENDTIATYQHYESNGSPLFLSAVNPTAIGTTLFPTLPSYVPIQQALGSRVHIPLDTTLVSNGTLFALSNATDIELADNLKLRTILGYDRSVTTRTYNTDGTPLVIGAQPRTPRTAPVRQYTAETQLLGKSFGERLDWTAGAFYLKNPYEDYVLQTGLILGFPNDSKGKSTNTSKAVFTQGTYDLSAMLSGLKATAGLRYTWDEKTSFDIGTGFGTNCTSVPTVNCSDSSARRTHYKSSALTWTTGLDYQVRPETLLYLASRRGYRAGGINVNVAGTILPSYSPEYVRDYELGMKSDWKIAGRPLRTNAAIYYQDYTDIQVTRAVFVNNGVLSLTDNASKARLWGVELETLLRLTDDLELGANASYLNIEYTEFAEGVSAATIADVKARENYSPSTQYGLNARYHLPLDQAVGDLSMQVHWGWHAAFRTSNAASLGEIEIPAIGLLNISVNWDHIGDGPLDASFFMTNVQNKDYVDGGNAVYFGSGYNLVRYGEPRMYGVRLRYRFGAQ